MTTNTSHGDAQLKLFTAIGKAADAAGNAAAAGDPEATQYAAAALDLALARAALLNIVGQRHCN